MRNCIQATTLRSQTIATSTVSTRKAKQNTAFNSTSHHGSWPKKWSVSYGCEVIGPPLPGPRKRPRNRPRN